jgi:tetratricopeptide (TPR) repeat protein
LVILVVAASILLAAVSPAAAQGAPGDSSSVYPSEQALRAYAQGRLLEGRGAFRDALQEYYRALLLDYRALDIANRCAELSLSLGDTDHAIEFAARVLEADSTDAHARWVRGNARFQLGQPDAAIADLTVAAEVDSERIEYWRSLAHIAELLDRVPVVERAQARIVELDDADAEAWFQLAAAQARLGRFSEAESSLAEAAALAPYRPGQWFLHGWIEESLDRPQVAIESYRKHLDIHPTDQATRRRLVHLLGMDQRWREAYGEARKVAAADPDDVEALEVQADLALKAGRPAEGRATVVQLIQKAGDNATAVGRASSILIRGDRAGEGIRLADEWARPRASSAEAVLLQARVRALARRLDDAVPFAERAIALQPDSLLPRLLLARVYSDSKRHDRAEQVLAAARERFPRDVALALEVATQREERGDVGGAVTAARDALRLEPTNSRSMNFLGYLLADHDQELVEAQRLIQGALEKEPDNGAYIDSLGWVYYRLGRLDEARLQLERAVELTGGDPVVHEHLGDVYRDLKLNRQARDQYRLSLARNGDNPRVKTKLAAVSQ